MTKTRILSRETGEEIIREEIREAEGNVIRYCLTSSTSGRVASFGLRLYSIKIELINGENSTFSEAKDIFADSGKAYCFFNKLVKNLATPMDLKYIIEDGLGD